MPTVDLLIRNAFIVDGTGAPGFTGDIAIQGDRIVGVGKVDADALETIDAEGKLVTPGWVDMHTHYDGQVTWDPYFTPSGWHGVTTVVMGNCGVGFAPCKEESREWLIQVMEGVEDIPGAALSEGIIWGWETFPEYLDFIDTLPHAIDFAAQVPHSAVRGWVMGETPSENEQPTAEQIREMADIVQEALEAGALGFSTSRTSLHRTARGALVAGTFAEQDELFGIAQALKRAGTGVFEIAYEHAQGLEEAQWMKAIAKDIGRPVIFNLSQFDQDPQLYTQMMGQLEEAAAEGIPLYAQSAGRAIGIVMGWQCKAHPFAAHLPWLEIFQKPWEEQKAILQSDGFKNKLFAGQVWKLGDFETMVTTSFHKMFPLRNGQDYEPDVTESIAAIAEREQRDPREVIWDWLMQDDCTGTLYFPLFNYSEGSLEPLFQLHSHPRVLMGLADGGAHCGAVCDAGMPTFMLTHWTRDRKRGDTLPLEYMVHRQTQQTANFYGLLDRGVLRAGYLADLNIIDYDALNLGKATLVHDLPAGGRRLVQRAEGYIATIKSGKVIVRAGEPTNVMAGRLLRGAQDAPEAPVSLRPMGLAAHLSAGA